MENPIRRALRQQVTEHLFATSQALGATRDDVITGIMQVAAAVVGCSTRPECRDQIRDAVAEEFRLMVTEAFDKQDSLQAQRDALAGMSPAGRA